LGKSGYTSLSLDEKRYAKLRKRYDQVVAPNTDDTFTKNVTDWIEKGIERIALIDKKFPNFTWVGNTESGCVIKDKNTIVEVKWSKNELVCSIHGVGCKHCIYAALNPRF
jgi:hypothetical protein